MRGLEEEQHLQYYAQQASGSPHLGHQQVHWAGMTTDLLGRCIPAEALIGV